MAKPGGRALGGILIFALRLGTLADTGPEYSQICTDNAVFFRTKTFFEWKDVDRTIKLTKLKRNLDLYKTGIGAVRAQAVNMSLKIDAAKGDELPDFDISDTWSYAQREDVLVTVTNVTPKQMKTKCKDVDSYLLTLGKSPDHNAALKALGAAAKAKTPPITKLVFDVTYSAEGAADRESGRVLSLYSGSVTFDAAANLVSSYGPAVYDIASKSFSVNSDEVIPSTFCIKPTPDYKLSKRHKIVERSAFSKLKSVLDKFEAWINQILSMISATPLESTLVQSTNIVEGVKSTWGLDQLLPFLLQLKDPHFYERDMGSPINRIRQFSILVEQFLANNKIINAGRREFILKITQSRIPAMVGTSDSIPLPYLRVKLVRRHPDEVMKMQVSYVRETKSAIYAVHPFLQDGHRLDLNVLVLSGDQTFLAQEAPSTNCLTLAHEHVCDVMIPSSANYHCASFLFGEPQPGQLADFCPMTKSTRELYSIPDVSCKGTPHPVTIIVSAIKAQLSLSCRELNQKVTMLVEPNSQVEVPTNYAKCDVRGPDGQLIRRSNTPASNNLLVSPFVPDTAVVRPGLVIVTTESTITTTTTSTVAITSENVVQTINTPREDSIKIPPAKGWNSYDYLTLAIGLLGGILVKIVILGCCYFIKGCRLYWYHALCCCFEQCAICSEHGLGRHEAEEHEFEPLSRQSRRSSLAIPDEIAGRVRQILDESSRPDESTTNEVALRTAIVRDRAPPSKKVDDEQIQQLLQLGLDMSKATGRDKRGRNTK